MQLAPLRYGSAFPSSDIANCRTSAGAGGGAATPRAAAAAAAAAGVVTGGGVYNAAVGLHKLNPVDPPTP
jgi:hypothetical protein